MDEQFEINKDENLEKLKQIGVEKIKEDTKLDSIRIRDILEKRFDRFNYVRARGFINILQKQYKLDLSEWMIEYCQHLPKDDEENERKQQEAYNRSLKRKKVYVLSILIVFCLICFVVLRFWYEAQVSPQVEKPLQKQEYDFVQPALQPHKSVENPQIHNQDQNIKIQNEAQSQSKEIQPSSDSKVSNMVMVQKPDKPTSEYGISVFEDDSIREGNTLDFSFQKPIWIGMIDLVTKNRLAQTKENFTFDLDKDLMFYIAYGTFDLTLDENVKEFRTYKPIFLIYTKDGGLRQLTKEEFVLLNGGIVW